MKGIIIALVCSVMLAGAFAKSIINNQYSFIDYTRQFNKEYDSQSEMEFRREIFNNNMRMILSHNANPHASYTMGVNHLTDRTDEEYTKLLGYKNTGTRKASLASPFVSSTKVTDLPTSVDWRDKGVVTAVKDQGQCGSCWSFGSAEVIESHYAIAIGQLQAFSEQMILDCVPNPDACGGTGGCQGGTPEIVYEKLIELGGLASEWTYPYVSYFGQNFDCHYQSNTTKPIAILKGYTKLPESEYEPVMEALATIGPLAINVDASAWRHYSTGVFTGCNTTNSDIDHVVLLVGYGTDTQLGDYWLIRNSWTPAWGEAGYIRIARSSTVQCTPDTQPSDGTGCNGGPSEVSVCGACGILYDVSYPLLSV